MASAGADTGLPWPPPENQLEKWMMNTIKEGDHAAQLMRSILNMNPAFGIYLREDQDLVGVVQTFAKRIRKVSLTEGQGGAQRSPTVLYQPLCEMVWRVVGLTMHSMMNLDSQSQMPVVKEACGMIKMLLQTNTELSSQLSQLRRAYFKELTAYRDRCRKLSKQAEHAIKGLEEQPIMFFEPLEFVLDETTKQFVREAIEERMKLELRTQFAQEDGNAEIAEHMDQMEKDLQEAQAKVRVLNNTVAREAEVRKRHEEIEAKLRQEIKLMREDGALGKLQEELEKRMEEIQELETRISTMEANPKIVEKTVEKEVVVVDDSSQNEALAKMQEQIDKMTAEAKKKAKELEQQQKKAAESEKAMKQMKVPGAKEIIKEKIVYQESPETEARLQKCLEVEAELREALRISELRASEAEGRVITKEVVKVEKPKAKKVVEPEPVDEDKKAKKDNTDKKIKEAIDKVTEEFQERIKKLSDKLAKVNAELEEKERLIDELMGADADAKKRAKAAKAEADRLAAAGEDGAKWRVKYVELEEKYEELQDEYAKLEAQVKGLVDKLRENMSEDEVKATMLKIEMSAPLPPRKKRKKKAYERLYDDAQRRIIEMRMKQAKLKELEQKALRKVVGRVSDRASLRKAEVLTHLHRAKTATTERFENALAEFEATVPGERGGIDYDDLVEESTDDEGVPADIRAQRLALMQQNSSFRDHSPDMICPRCGYHTASLYGRSPMSTGPIVNSSGGPFPNVLLSSTPSTPPWMAPPPPSLAPVMGRPLLHSSSTGSLGSGVGGALSRSMTMTMGAASSMKSRDGSPTAARSRDLSPAQTMFSPTILASQGGGPAGLLRPNQGNSLASSMPNLRSGDLRGGDVRGMAQTQPWQRRLDAEPMRNDLMVASTSMGRSAGTPPSLLNRRFAPAPLARDAADNRDSRAAERQALFPSAPPWRSPDTRSPSPSPGVSKPAAASAKGASSRSASPHHRMEQVTSAPVVAPDWFGLQATPPWRRGVAAETSALRSSSGSDRQVGNIAAAPAAAAAPRGAPPAAGVAGAGRGLRTPSDPTSGIRRPIPSTLDPISRTVSFAGHDVSPRQALLAAAGSGSPRSRSPTRSPKVNLSRVNASDDGSPDRVASAPTKTDSGHFSDASDVQTTRRAFSPESSGAVQIGGGGHSVKYRQEWSQSVPSVTSVHQRMSLPAVAGREIPAETMKDQQWEPVRRTPNKSIKKVGMAVQALTRMTPE